MTEQGVIMEKIARYVSLIERGDKIAHALNRLERIPMTLSLLSSTGVGKVVNRFRSDSEYGSLATRIVESWRNIAKLEHENEKYPPSSSTSTATSSSLKFPTKENKVKSKEKRKVDTEIDAFSAALAAADNLNNSKSKRPKYEDHILAGIEKSLADSARSLSRIDPSSTMKPSTVEDKSDQDMFKARKNTKTQVYAGRRKAAITNGQVPKLFDICLKYCINNIDAIEETGSIPFYVLEPVLEKCTHSQLAKIEAKNKYLEEDSDFLWERHCQEVFPNFETRDDTSWKQCFLRLTRERDERLKRLSAKIGSHSRESAAPQRKVMLADPIAPRDARRRQIKNGTVCHSSAVPDAAELSRSRRQIFESGSSSELQKIPSAIRNAAPTQKQVRKPINPLLRSKETSAPKKGALMLKTLKMLKGRPR